MTYHFACRINSNRLCLINIDIDGGPEGDPQSTDEVALAKAWATTRALAWGDIDPKFREDEPDWDVTCINDEDDAGHYIETDGCVSRDNFWEIANSFLDEIAERIRDGRMYYSHARDLDFRVMDVIKELDDKHIQDIIRSQE
jgi:hypothetical protein